MRGRLARFLITGTIGFLTDGLLMLAASNTLGISVLMARGVSFPIAVTVTWQLNRHWTFEHGRSRRAGGQYVLYLAGQLISLAINYGVFALLVTSVSALHPLLALASGAACALVFSYLYARMVAFREARPEGARPDR
ncbi:MAG: GtrA family protein [Gammaproteobacteria bacterium]|nr:GtrA family protein [Gammaproteobacteria bacterium]